MIAPADAPPGPVEIVPVVDIKHGLAVRARAGAREAYRPIETPLARTADPVEVARGLLDAFPARRLYVADLDAIEGRGRDVATLQRIAAACPGIELWVDAGFADAGGTRAFMAEGIGRPVIGSESQTGLDLLDELGGTAVLSLDFRGDEFLGPPGLLAEAARWPDDIIVMTLARVGSGAGPDLARLAAVKLRAPGKRVFAAGGLRGPQDLAPLARLGAAGVLVASALHDGRLRPEHLNFI